MEQKATYTALKSQIDKLQKEAEEILKTEKVAVIERIKEAVAVYGLTAKDLGLGKQLRKPRPKRVPRTPDGTNPQKSDKKPRAAKYADGKGNEWNGRGEQPEWVKAAIVAGRSLNDLRRRTAK